MSPPRALSTQPTAPPLPSCDAGVPEPPIPWHSHLYPDGTPVSFTEAAAIRRHVGGTDDFLALDTFLEPRADAPESFLSLEATQSHTLAARQPLSHGMYELTLWPEAVAGSFRVDISDGGGAPAFEVLLNVTRATLELSRGGHVAATHDIGATALPEGGVVPASWNMLRVLVSPPTDTHSPLSRVRVWFNPQFSDATGGSVPPADEQKLVAMPPRIDTNLDIATGSTFRVTAVDAPFRVDYMSILPPTLYGLSRGA